MSYGEVPNDRPIAPDRAAPAPPDPERDEDDAEPEFGLPPDLAEEVSNWLEEGPEGNARLRAAIADLYDADVADLLERLGEDERVAVVERLGDDFPAEILAHLNHEVADALLRDLEPRRAARLIDDLESDDAIELTRTLPDDVRAEILRHLSARLRSFVEQGLTFPESSAGRLIQRDVVAFPQFWTVGKVLDYLRAIEEPIETDFHTVFLVDPLYRVAGVVPASRILCAKRGVKLAALMEADFHKVPVTMDQEDVAYLFRQYGLLSAPVVDESDRLLGVITVDDIVDVITEEAEEDILALGGVSAAETGRRGIVPTVLRRATWLGVNLLTAFVAATVIRGFADSIEQLVALAVLMPIVASMGGNAGTQALTVAVRAIATRELDRSTAWRTVGRELAVALANGLLFAVIVGAVAWAWFGDVLLGAVIAAALVINLVFAGLFGAVIPMTLSRLRVDPALGSGVLLTFVTDVVGFLAFLGLATWILL